MSNDEAIRQFRKEWEEIVHPKPKRPEAEIVLWPGGKGQPLSEMELVRRQAIIDATWERVLAERRETEKEMKRCCHRGPGDPDWRK